MDSSLFISLTGIGVYHKIQDAQNALEFEFFLNWSPTFESTHELVEQKELIIKESKQQQMADNLDTFSRSIPPKQMFKRGHGASKWFSAAALEDIKAKLDDPEEVVAPDSEAGDSRSSKMDGDSDGESFGGYNNSDSESSSSTKEFDDPTEAARNKLVHKHGLDNKPVLTKLEKRSRDKVSRSSRF